MMTPKKKGCAAAAISTALLIIALGATAAYVARNSEPSTPGSAAQSLNSIPNDPTLQPKHPVAFRRFFAPTATWNRPVSEFGASTALAPFAPRFYEHGGGTAPAGQVRLDFRAYSVPIYDATTATTTARVFQVRWAQDLAKLGNVPIGTEIPWNPAWTPGTGRPNGGDRIMAEVDYAKGKVWEMWVVGEPKLGCVDLFGPNARSGYDMGNDRHLCMAGLHTYDNLFDATDGTTIGNRGMGINKLALVTRAEEVQQGHIDHALELTIAGIMFGMPMCQPADNNSAPGAGTDCGFYVPPATRLEQSYGSVLNCGANTQKITPEVRATTVPSGMRFAIHITDAEIETWLDSRGFVGAKRNTAKVFAVAWRDYGAIVAETGCYGVAIETDGILNPESAKRWAELGVTPDGTEYPSGDLLDGLLTKDRLYVVNPTTTK